jgi:hypothetical protein
MLVIVWKLNKVLDAFAYETQAMMDKIHLCELVLHAEKESLF